MIPGVDAGKNRPVFIALGLCFAATGLLSAIGPTLQLLAWHAGGPAELDETVLRPRGEPQEDSGGRALVRVRVRVGDEVRRSWVSIVDVDRPRGTPLLAWPPAAPKIAAEPGGALRQVWAVLSLLFSLGIVGASAWWIVHCARLGRNA